jgi:hypothetical protein
VPLIMEEYANSDPHKDTKDKRPWEFLLDEILGQRTFDRKGYYPYDVWKNYLKWWEKNKATWGQPAQAKPVEPKRAEGKKG